MGKDKNKPTMGVSVGTSDLNWQKWQNKRLAKEENGWEALRKRQEDKKRKFMESWYKGRK